MVKHIMLDLETWSSKSNAVVVAIGAIAFDHTHISTKKLYIKIDPAVQIKKGFDVDASTMRWWLEQPARARREFYNNVYLEPTGNALDLFTEFCKNLATPDKLCMWGNGASFDNAVIENLYDKFKRDMPWSYKGDRCYRTMKNIYKDVPESYKPSHIAIEDAIMQADHLVKICKKKGITLQ